MVTRAALVIACSAIGVASGPGIACAEGSLADKAAAQTLFDEGRKLMAAGKLAEACPKLAESQKLDPGVGTQFNLADCYERLGQTASAWAGFLEAASAAKAMGQSDREKVAKDRAGALALRLSRLTITSSEVTPPSGLEIKKDGAPVGHALWGTAIPVDPGSHVVEVSAPGKKTWQTTVRVEGEKASVVVKIPALQDAPQAQEPPDVASTGVDATSSGSSHRTLGLVVGGAGIVGLGVSGVIALGAKGKYTDSLDHCRADAKNLCDSVGFDLRSQARNGGNLATIVGGIGAAALVAGVVLFVTAPSSEKRSIAVIPNAGPGSAGLVLLGAY